MKTMTINYFDEQQKLIGELFYDEKIEDAKQPAIILFPAFEGRGDFALDYAKKLVEKGFITFVADIYGDAAVSETLEGCFKLVSPFLQDRELVRKRAILAYKTLLQQKNVDPNKIGAVGFCFGGMCVLELARSGENLEAGVSIHGAFAKSNLETFPIKSKILLLHGYQDPQVPPTGLHDFAKEMSDAGVKDWTFTFFGEAKHSFTDLKTGTFDSVKEREMGREYNQVAAKRSFQYAVDFFDEMALICVARI